MKTLKSDTVRLHAAFPPVELELLEASHARIQNRLVPFSIAFCERLAIEHSTLRRLFPIGDAGKREAAVSFLRFVVANLRSTDLLGRVLEQMGARGLIDGLSATCIDDLGRTFLGTLSEFEDRDDWTIDTEHAWALAWVWASAAIRRGMRQRVHPLQRGLGA
jgi:hypothetical protein